MRVAFNKRSRRHRFSTMYFLDSNESKLSNERKKTTNVRIVYQQHPTAHSNSTSQSSWLQNALTIYILRKNGYLNTPKFTKKFLTLNYGILGGFPSPAPGPGLTWDESPHLVARFLGNPLQSFPQVALSHEKKNGRIWFELRQKKTFLVIQAVTFLGWLSEPFQRLLVTS